METKQMIADGKTALGIEFGSTRIQSCTDRQRSSSDRNPEAMTGKIVWRIIYGTYTLEDIWSGLQDSSKTW